MLKMYLFSRFNFVLMVLFVVLFSLPLFAQDMFQGKLILSGTWKGMDIEYLESEILVILEPGVEQKDVLKLFQSHNATVTIDFNLRGFGKIEIPKKTDLISLAAILENQSTIKAAEPNIIGGLSYTPNDEFYLDGKQWGLKTWDRILLAVRLARI